MSIRSVMVGTNTSASASPAASSAAVRGRSSGLKVVSNSAAIRASTGAGSLRVTKTVGLAMAAFEKGLGEQG